MGCGMLVIVWGDEIQYVIPAIQLKYTYTDASGCGCRNCLSLTVTSNV